MLSLAIGLAGLHHLAGRTCFIGAPPWDYVVGMALPLGMGLVAAATLALGFCRLATAHRLITGLGSPATPDLESLAAGLAGRMGCPPPRVLRCPLDHPLAFTWGMRRPALLLSDWMLRHLDSGELEAVMAHEIAHVTRRDYGVLWSARVLRDAFFNVPASRTAYRQLQADKELACDDATVAATGRPLDLASALTKVWQHAVREPRWAAAQGFAGDGRRMEGRTRRLLAPPPDRNSPRPSSLAPLVWGAGAHIGLVALEAATFAVFLGPMGCAPHSLLGWP